MASLFDLIFTTILRINPQFVAQYTTLQDQILYLLFIPHVILLLFIYFLAVGVVGRVVGQHRGMQYLVSLAVYAYVILSGLYGNTLVPLFVNWFIIAIGIGLIVFLISIVIHPARGRQLLGFASTLGKSVGELTVGKAKKVEELEKRLHEIDKEIADLQREPQSEYKAFKLDRLKEEKKIIEKELRG